MHITSLHSTTVEGLSGTRWNGRNDSTSTEHKRDLMLIFVSVYSESKIKSQRKASHGVAVKVLRKVSNTNHASIYPIIYVSDDHSVDVVHL